MGQPAQADDQSPYGTYITTYRDDISCAWAALRFTQETGRSYRCYGSALWLMF